MKHNNHGNSKDHSHQGQGHAAGGEGKDRNLHNPIEDRLIPLEPLDLAKIHSIDGLVRAMSKTAFTGRQLGEAADVLEAITGVPLDAAALSDNDFMLASTLDAIVS